MAGERLPSSLYGSHHFGCPSAGGGGSYREYTGCSVLEQKYTKYRYRALRMENTANQAKALILSISSEEVFEFGYNLIIPI